MWLPPHRPHPLRTRDSPGSQRRTTGFHPRRWEPNRRWQTGHCPALCPLRSRLPPSPAPRPQPQVLPLPPTQVDSADLFIDSIDGVVIVVETFGDAARDGQDQRKLAKAIKVARYLGLMPYVGRS